MKTSRLVVRAVVALGVFSVIVLLAGIGAKAQVPKSAGRKTEFFNGREVVAGQVLVKFREPAPQSLAQVKREADVDTERAVGRGGARLFHSRSKNTATLVRELSARADVLYAEPNYVIRTAAVPNDPRFSELWGLKNTGQPAGSSAVGVAGADIDAASAWDVSTGSRENVVAVIDTGVDYRHPDLAANMWSAPAAFTVNIGGQEIRCEAGTHGYNAITKTCDPADEYDHGTHVAGTIGAAGNNGVGGVGINWVASIMDIKFIDASGSGTLSDAIDAIEFAIQAKQALGAGANVRVLSNSWGWNGGASQALLDQINFANESDMLFVAGAGNGGADGAGDDNDAGGSPFYPASYDAPNVVAVAATDHNDALAPFSNYGASRVHLGAPGVLVFSTIKGGLYDWWSGTSMATPHVSGAAALLLSRCPLDTENLKGALLNNVDPLASLSGVTATGGRLNVNKALRSCADLTKPANRWPSAELLYPNRDGETFSSPAYITVSADASDSDGAVSRVDFFAGKKLIGTDSSSPYSVNWGVSEAGSYSITAAAVDDMGATTTSRPVNIVVNVPTPTPTPTPSPSPTPTPVPSPTPTPTPTPTPAPSPTLRVNHALASQGSTTTASSTMSPYVASFLTDGDRAGLDMRVWLDNTYRSWPDWAEVSFPGAKTIDEVVVVTRQDSTSPAEPTEQTTFSKYGVTSFEAQYWTAAGWQTVPGGSVSGNDRVMRRLTFPAVTTTKIRVIARAGADNSYSRLVEVEAWGTQAAPPPPAGRVNHALASNGGVASASSQMSPYLPSFLTDGDRAGLDMRVWLDNTYRSWPDWAEVTFPGARSVDEISVFTRQDSASPVEPTEQTKFTLYGATAFDVQYWTGSSWATVPGGAVTANDVVWRRFTFPAVTTTKIRVVVRAGADNSYTRLVEVEAWGG